MDTNTNTPKNKPFVVHRRSPGLHWWVDAEGRDHGPYVHQQPAKAAARAARRERLKHLEIEMLYGCPFCRQHGFTRLGLRQHFCTRAPALPGEDARNHKGSRKLTTDEWRLAVAGKEASLS